MNTNSILADLRNSVVSKQPQNGTLSFSFLSPRNNFMPVSPSSGNSGIVKRNSFFKEPPLSTKFFTQDIPSPSPILSQQKSSKFSPKGYFNSAIRPLPNKNLFASSRQQSFEVSQDNSRKNSTNSISNQKLSARMQFLQNFIVSPKEITNEEGSKRSSPFQDDSFISYASQRTFKREDFIKAKANNFEEISQPIPLTKTIRRKSCYCSDCGGMSKKEKLHLNLAQPCPREIAKTTMPFIKLLAKDFRDDLWGSTPMGSTRSRKANVGSKDSQHGAQTAKSLGSLKEKFSFRQEIQRLNTLGTEGVSKCGAYCLSKFARGRKLAITRTFSGLNQEEQEAGEKSIKMLEEKVTEKGSIKSIHEVKSNKGSIGELNLETEISVIKNSFEDSANGRGQSIRDEKNIPSIDLDFSRRESMKFKEGQNEEDFQDEVIENEVQIKEGKDVEEISKSYQSLYSEIKSLEMLKASNPSTLARIDVGQENKKPEKPIKFMKSLNGLGSSNKKGPRHSSKNARKLRQLTIQEIYVTKPKAPFLNSLANQRSQSIRSIEGKLPLQGNYLKENLQENQILKTEGDVIKNGKNIKKEFRSKIEPLFTQSVKAINDFNTLDQQLKAPGKSSCKAQSMMVLDKTEKNQNIKKGRKLKTSLLELKSEKEVGKEKVILKTFNEKQKRVKTLVVGELNKIYKPQRKNEDVKIGKIR